MKLEPPSSEELLKRVTRNKEYFLKSKMDSFSELTEWISLMKWPAKNEIYTPQQILEIKEFIEISEGIQISKKSLEDKIILRCKKVPQCGFYVQFQLCPSKRMSQKVSFYQVFHSPKTHQASKDSICHVYSQQVLLKRRKMFLNLIRPIIKEILKQDQSASDEKNPTWVMKKLEKIRKQKPNFIFVGLTGQYKRQLKKAFDNAVLKVKNEINIESGLTKKSLKKLKKSKKIKKSSKSKVKLEPEENGFLIDQEKLYLSQVKEEFNEQKIEIKMIEEEEFEEKSPNVFEKCFNEIKMEDILEQKRLRIKPESNLYQTPTKKKQKFGFDLENSTEKRRTTYNKSCQQSQLHETMGKEKKMKSDSEQEVWTPQRGFRTKEQKILQSDFHLDSRNSSSQNDSGCFKNPMIEKRSQMKEKRKSYEKYFA